MRDFQKTLKEVNVLRDLSGHNFAAENGYNIWTTPSGTWIEKIRSK